MKSRKDLLQFKSQLEEEKATVLHKDNSLALTVLQKAIPLISPFVIHYAVGKLPIKNKIVRSSLQKGASIAIPFVMKVLLDGTKKK